ncbi:MAG: DinB family protein [Candidatus Rokubacteria bacterium]|nr:DinB family protein [Candidatus Rokubacteria bacterium]
MAVAVDLILGLYAYHRWANRRLFDEATALGADADRELGKQFSFPTIRGMFAHIYGADWIWLSRWQGTSPTRLPDATDFPTLAELRRAWDELEREQRQFVEGLGETDLAREIDFRDTAGRPSRLALGPMLQHVANHATHHRSELATMLTMLRGSPPPTDLVVYLRRPPGRS